MIDCQVVAEGGSWYSRERRADLLNLHQVLNRFDGRCIQHCPHFDRCSSDCKYRKIDSQQYHATLPHFITLSHLWHYSVVQKNSCMFEFAAFLPPTDLGLPMHSPSALTENVSLNLARFFCSTLYAALWWNIKIGRECHLISCTTGVRFAFGSIARANGQGDPSTTLRTVSDFDYGILNSLVSW